MDANRLKYAPASLPPSALASPPPGVWHAFGLIALYFALQLAIGGLVGLAAGVYGTLRQGDIISLGFPAAKLHLFDAASGQRL